MNQAPGHTEGSTNDENKTFLSYYVMPRYGKNLEYIFEQHNHNFGLKTIVELGLKLLDIIEMIHNAGYTYNDMKLDNILVGDHTMSEKTMHQIRLIDFGFAARFLDKNRVHIAEEEVDVFRSNMIFATVNQFDFKVTSRRDDLQSLCYLLIYLFNSGDVPFVEKNNLSKRDTFLFIKNVKERLSPYDLAGPPEKISHCMLDFIIEVFSYGFKDVPDYTKLKILLLKCQPNYTS
jgi:serine/threonine protein kinase